MVWEAESGVVLIASLQKVDVAVSKLELSESYDGIKVLCKTNCETYFSSPTRPDLLLTVFVDYLQHRQLVIKETLCC